MPLILAIFWVLAGCFISAIYTFLASGTLDHFFITALLAPPIAFFLVIAWGVSGFRLPRRGEKQLLEFRLCLSINVFFCLPIILNGASIVSSILGYETTAKYLFNLRYLSLLATLLLFVLVLCGISAVIVLSRKIRGMLTGKGRPPGRATPQSIMQGLEGTVFKEDYTPR